MSSTPHSAAEARLRPDWDATSTYDVLDTPAAHAGVFVGRQDLLHQLESAMLDPHKRGTVLVSGYRGSGKTTLVIEALRRAETAFMAKSGTGAPRLLSVVLNVSEVSTSLPASAEGTSAAPLQVDPRRLLIALLRAFRQRLARITDSELRSQIHQLYAKATAAEWKIAQSESRSRESVRTREAGISIESGDLLKGALLPAGLVSLGLAALGTGDSLLDQVVKGSAAAFGVVASAAGLAFSAKRSDKTSVVNGGSTQTVHDNSLQQLEGDLKDLLHSLSRHGWRTVIVLEELDKLDGQGEELDAVIRYFKNLFTQAPALFVFLTDKVYYDRIGREISHARRGRSYAVAHTFFTHRLFVGRPSTRDCLDFIEALLLDEADRVQVRKIYTSGRWATEAFGAQGQQARGVEPRLSLFVRVMLFRASNHLFDLKAELQRYVRHTPGGPVLRFDDDAFPPEDQALAKFQDLLADKARAFMIRGGRGYANEVLHDCLAGVFHQVGSSSARPVAELLPQEQSGEHMLDPAEYRRIAAAVESLLDDLQRGRALERVAGADDSPAIEWKPQPAEAFALVRRLEAHEIELLQKLGAVQDSLVRLRPLMPMAAAWTQETDTLLQSLRQRIESAGDLDTSIGVDEAQREARDAADAAARLTADVREAFVTDALVEHGLDLFSTPVAETSSGHKAMLLVTGDGDFRTLPAGARGATLLVHGTGTKIRDAVRAVAERVRLQRLAIVLLSDEPLTDSAARQVQGLWMQTLSLPLGWMTGQPLHLRVRAVELGAKGTHVHLARELLAAGLWAVRPPASTYAGPHDSVRVADAVAAWMGVTFADGTVPALCFPDAVPSFERMEHAVRLALWESQPEGPWLLPAERGDLGQWSFDAGVHAGSLDPKQAAARGARLAELISLEAGALAFDADAALSASAYGGQRHMVLRRGLPDDSLGTASVSFDALDATGDVYALAMTVAWGRDRMAEPPRSEAA